MIVQPNSLVVAFQVHSALTAEMPGPARVARAQPALLGTPYGQARLPVGARAVQLPVVPSAVAVECGPQRVRREIRRRIRELTLRGARKKPSLV